MAVGTALTLASLPAHEHKRHGSLLAGIDLLTGTIHALVKGHQDASRDPCDGRLRYGSTLVD